MCVWGGGGGGGLWGRNVWCLNYYVFWDEFLLPAYCFNVSNKVIMKFIPSLVTSCLCIDMCMRTVTTGQWYQTTSRVRLRASLHRTSVLTADTGRTEAMRLRGEDQLVLLMMVRLVLEHSLCWALIINILIQFNLGYPATTGPAPIQISEYYSNTASSVGFILVLVIKHLLLVTVLKTSSPLFMVYIVWKQNELNIYFTTAFMILRRL